MKKIVKTLCALIVILSTFSGAILFAQGNESDKEKVFFYTKGATPDGITDFLTENYVGLGRSIYTSYQTMSNICFGNCISVLNCDNLFFIPVFSNEKCITILSVCIDDQGQIAISYGDQNTQYLNSLKPGNYYFEKSGDSIYLLGKNIKYVFERDSNSQLFIEPSYLPSKLIDYDLVNLHEIKESVNGGTKGILSKELSTVPYVANGGTYGWCWLASATSICKYYGSDLSLEDAHRSVHGLAHPLLLCPGGTVDDSYGVIHFCTGKTGSKTASRRTAHDVFVSINSNIPIYSSWRHYTSNGSVDSSHAMVICGYTFDNTSGAFTYTLMDPNYSTRRYVYSTYYASEVNYLLNGLLHEWEVSIYDWK